MTTPRKKREKAPTIPGFNQREIFPSGLGLKSVNAAFYYSNFYASQSDEYDSDVPQKERVPLVTNDKKRHFKLVKRNEDSHQWKTKISESELQQVKEWTDKVSKTLQQFEISPTRISRQKQGEEEGGSRVALPCAESYYSEAYETDCSRKAKEKKMKRKENSGGVGDITTDCESVIGDRKKKEKKKKRRSEVESATDCESTILSEKEREKENEEGGEGSVYDSGLSVSSVGEKKKKKKEKREGFGCFSDNPTESECEVRIGEDKQGEDNGIRMKRQRESGSEDGGRRNSDKRSKKEKRQSETEEEFSSRVASKKSVVENIVKIGGKEKRRESAGKTVENSDSDDDFREDLRKKRESYLKTVVAKRGEKRHSVSDSEDGGMEESPTNQGMEEGSDSSDNRKGKSPTKKSPKKSPKNSPKKSSKNQSNTDISDSSDDDRPLSEYQTNQRSGKSPIKKASVNEKSNSSDSDSEVDKMNKSSTSNQRSGKSPIKKVSVNEQNDSSDSDSEDKRMNNSSTSNQRSGKSPIKKVSVNEQNDSSDSDSEDKRVNNSSTSNKFKSLKTVYSSLKKSSNDEMMSQDMFEADSDDRNNEVENNSDSSESVKNNGDKSRNGDSDSDDRQEKTNSKSNSDKRRNRDGSSESNSDSDSSSSKIQEKSKVSNKSSISKQDDTTPKQVTKTSKNDASKTKSPEKQLNPKKTDSLLNSSEILSNFEVNSQEIFKTPSHKKKNATSTPFHSQAARQDLEQTMDMSAISNRLNNSSRADKSDDESSSSSGDKVEIGNRVSSSSRPKSNSSRADKSGSSSDSDEGGSTIMENNQSYTQTIIPKLWKRIEKKLSEGIKEEYFEEDVFYLEDLSDNDEVWVAPCPKSLDVSSLLGRKLNLTGRTDLKALQAKDGASNMDCEAWASPIEQNENVVYCLQASKNRKKMIINPLKLAGRVSIEEKIQMPSPHEVEFSTTMKLVMPENLKVRHPLLGAEFKNQPKTFNSDDVSLPRVKKKKKSKNLEHESEIMQNPTSSINHASTIEENCDESMERKKKKKKKKKSRDNESAEGQGDMSSHSHKSEDTLNLSESEKKKRKNDKKRPREEADEEPSLQEDVPCEESSEHSSKKKKKKKRRLDE